MILPVAALGCVLATLVAQADLSNVSSQIGITPWGTSISQSSAGETATGTDSVIGTCVQVDPGDCLIIASTDRQAMKHAVSFSWRAADEQTPQSRTFTTVGRNLTVDTIYPEEMRSVESGQRYRIPGSSPSRLNGDRSEAVGNQVPTTRVFRVPVFDHPLSQSPVGRRATSERVCEATCLTASDQLAVYSTDQSLSEVNAEVVKESLTSGILAEVEQRIGAIADLDSNRRLTVVLSRLTTTAIDHAEPVLGCVRPADFFCDDTMSGDIVYLDPRVVDSEAFEAVLAHELAHAAVFSRLRKLQDSGIPVRMLPSWLNEAVAHACERDLFPGSSNLSGRIKSWRDDTGRWPLMPNISRRSDVSTRGPERAAGWMFVEFLRQEQSLRELVDSVALGTDSTLDADDEAFAATFREWTVWMAKQHGNTICRRPDEMNLTQVICGTAARWYRVDVSGEVSIQGDASSLLQITLLKSVLKRNDKPHLQSSLSVAATESE